MSLSIKALLLFSLLAVSKALDSLNEIEPRGKKKKIGLFIYFADLVIKKIFLLKIIYAVVFWIVIHKAGYFLHWFVSYLKEHKKHHYHEHSIPHYYDHGHQGPYRKKRHGVF